MPTAKGKILHWIGFRKTSPKQRPQLILNRGRIEPASRMGFWSVLGGLGTPMVDFWGRRLQNMTKTVPKIDLKSMKSEGCDADASWGTIFVSMSYEILPKWVSFWSPFSTKDRKMAYENTSNNRCRKGIEIVCQKVFKMMPKRRPTSIIFHVISTKAKMHETIEFTIESVVASMQKRVNNLLK